MPDRMFSDVVEPGITIGHRHWYTLPLSIAAHTAILAVVVIAPLMAADVLPAPNAIIAFVASPPPPSPPPPPPPVQQQAARPIEPQAPAAAPIDAPSGIAPEHERDQRPNDYASVESSSGLVPGDVSSVAPVVLPVAPPAPEPAAPLPIGGNIKPPTKTRDVKPVYPQIALASRVQGLVIIAATIGPTGRVENARILRSSPLLDDAALEAVRQWEFTPTLLNGAPASVVMTVTVNFSLQ